MSYSEKIFEIVVNMSEDMGVLKSGMEEVKQDIAELKKKKPWFREIDWAKLGKGAGYIIISVAVAGGGVAGLSSWFGFFR